MTKRNSGFVLLAVLACIALAVVVAVDLTNQVHLERLRLMELRQTVRYRWGCRSLERCLIRLTRDYDERSPHSNGSDSSPVMTAAPTIAAGALDIGEFQYEWVLSNEQAKVNVNMLAANLSRARFTATVRRLIEGSELVVRPPSRAIERISNNSIRYPTYAHIFDAARNDRSNSVSRFFSASNHCTCWGPGGRLDWRNATDASLLTVARLALDEPGARRLVAARRELQPADSVDRLFAAAALPPPSERELANLLTDSSRAFSVRTSTHLGQRPVDRLLVIEQVDGATRIAKVWGSD